MSGGSIKGKSKKDPKKDCDKKNPRNLSDKISWWAILFYTFDSIY